MPNTTRRLLLGSAALAGLPRAARAQAWPSRPVRLIVPLVPGGTTDLIARVIADPLSKLIGGNVVVENRPGANGWIANDYVMRERPDGHTLIVNNVSTHAINSAMAGPERGLVPSRGLVPITNLIEAPQFFLAPADFPATSLADFVARAKASPKPLVYASAGVGSYQHIDLETFARRAGINLVHLPLRGAGEIVPVLLRGDAQITEFNVSAAAPHIEAGRMRPLAIVARQRLAAYPDTPTTVEAGFPDLVTTLWNGLFAPAGTPDALIAALHRHVVSILRDPEVLAALERQAVRATPSDSPAAFAAYLAEDVARWSALTREFNIQLN
ncbi:Bug family tripartite tricarboxylate transporter substrate binding protein [Roseomonas populi]|uniref:Tripartite tricarboxylate transporter substrate binding protein n=1 Tax=Roseomonas populi TaxID=3121582 RepID=A0ABT1XAK7_9PROT|nr:tripartite tricarboxylate transporter substrate binding protein [Roseomonas pecuniae]MCR0985153.1 tripartite tricarboxylate transporter substrate binding protein [Roseomonas pecuniae]